MESRLLIRWPHWRPFFLLLHLLVVLIWCSSLSSVGAQKPTNCSALYSFRDHLFRSIGNRASLILSSWKHSANCCAWKGVNCTSGVVTGLILPSLDLTGSIPPSLLDLGNLTYLDLSHNGFSGPIPPGLDSLQWLRYLDLSWNVIGGETFPNMTMSCSQLQILNLEHNVLGGSIPWWIGDCSSLEIFKVGYNNLNGTIPSNLLRFHSIRILDVSANSLSGTVPLGFHLLNLVSLSLSSNRLRRFMIPDVGYEVPNLDALDLSNNEFDEWYSSALCDGGHLRKLNVSGNQLGHSNWSSISFLANCTKLQELDLSNNGFNGFLSPSIAYFPTQLVSLRLRGNKILGGMPYGIQELRYLNILDMGNTSLSGRLPSVLSNVTSLKELMLDRNNLTGGLSETVVSFKNLHVLDISQNGFSGFIPRQVFLSSNALTSLNLSNNKFFDTLPDVFGDLHNLTTLDVSYNNLSGKIPPTLANCKQLKVVLLQKNTFNGSIPEFFRNLPGLERLDLSFNNLTGPVPTGGIFDDPFRFLIYGNANLCGGNRALKLAPCPDHERKSGSGGLPNAALAIVVVIAVIFFSLLLYWLFHKYKCFIKKPSDDSSKQVASPQFPSGVSYADLQRATEGFSPEKLIGSGGIGSVYRGYFERENKEVAVKLFHRDSSGDSRSFIRESKNMRNVVHRNLVQVLSYCASANKKKNPFKALVYELMPNGNLEMWLHQDVVSLAVSFKRWNLRLLDRLNMAIDVASALIHLHGQPEKPIVHGNLKPSNVLIAADMTAHVTDFGLSNIFAMDAVIGTSVGYVAPEYTKKSPIAPQWDVYSFGVLLLEMFTGKRPTDRDLKDDKMSLHDYVLGRYVPNVEDAVDPLLLSEEINSKLTDTTRECLVSIINIALICSEELPEYRMEMKDALEKLQTAKKALQMGGGGDRNRTFGSAESEEMLV